MFCIKCGKQMDEGSVFCSECGTRTASSPVSNVDDTPSAISTDTSTDINEKDFLNVLICKNQPYYLKQFEKIERGEKSFNWCVFFFAPIVLLYRKQYSYFNRRILPIYILSFIYIIIQALVSAYLLTTSNFGILSVVPVVYISMFGFSVVMTIVCAMGFNKQYLSNLKNAISENHFTSESIQQPSTLKIIDKKFKPSAITPILAIIIYSIIMFVISNTMIAAVANSFTSQYGLDSSDYESSATEEFAADSVNNEEVKTENDSQVEGTIEFYKINVPTITDNKVELPDQTITFIKSNENLFPAKTDADKKKLLDLTDADVSSKQLNKNIEAYFNKIIVVNGTLVGVEQKDISGIGGVTTAHILDGDMQSYEILYLGETDLYSDDNARVHGVPVGAYSFENVGGGYTNSIVLIAGSMEKLASVSNESSGNTNVTTDSSTQDDYDDTSGNAKADSYYYIFPNSDWEYLTEDDIHSIDSAYLPFARNEIFARHGYIFKNEDYRVYFSDLPWYSEDPNYDQSMLNDVEKRNADFIKSFE